MSIVKTEAFVLDSTAWREMSRIVRVFSKEYGKISVVAKGARRAKSATSGLDDFNHVALTLFLKEQSDFGNLREVEILDNHRYLHADLEKIACAAVFMEIVSKSIQPHHASPRLFDFTVEFFKNLANSAATIPYCMLMLLRLVARLGFSPVFSSCAQCGATRNLVAFSGREGGAVCGRCAGSSDIATIPLSKDLFGLFQAYAQIAPDALQSLAMSDNDARTCYRIVHEMIERHLELQLKSTRFLESIIPLVSSRAKSE